MEKQYKVYIVCSLSLFRSFWRICKRTEKPAQQLGRLDYILPVGSIRSLAVPFRVTILVPSAQSGSNIRLKEKQKLPFFFC